MRRTIEGRRRRRERQSKGPPAVALDAYTLGGRLHGFAYDNILRAGRLWAPDSKDRAVDNAATPLALE
jgi:hypothetical protein